MYVCISLYLSISLSIYIYRERERYTHISISRYNMLGVGHIDLHVHGVHQDPEAAMHDQLGTLATQASGAA